MIQGQTHAALAEEVIDLLFQLSTDTHIANLVYRGDSGEELSTLENHRYCYLFLVQFRYHENIHYQYRNGLYEEDEYATQRTLWRNNVFSRKGTVGVWCEEQAGFPRRL